MGGNTVSMGVALALTVSVLGAPSVGASTQLQLGSDGTDMRSLDARSTTEDLPVESRVWFRKRDVADLDRLQVVGATGYGSYGTNGPITRVCVWAKLSLDDRHRRTEGGCIDDLERDSSEFVYRFDGVRWEATTTATFPTTTETWRTNASGKVRLIEEGPPSSTQVKLLWSGVGQERNRPWASAFPCFLTVMCARVGIERIRHAQITGVVELGGLDVAVELARNTKGTMRWSKGI